MNIEFSNKSCPKYIVNTFLLYTSIKLDGILFLWQVLKQELLPVYMIYVKLICCNGFTG